MGVTNSLPMIQTQTFRLERSSQFKETKVLEQDILDLDQLAFEAEDLCRQVDFIQTNFQGPDYFGLDGNFSDLQALLQKYGLELNQCQQELDQQGIEMPGGKSYKVFYKNSPRVKKDAESIAFIANGLGDLIRSFRVAAKEAGKEEFYSVKEKLEAMVKELENSQWIFSLFVRYQGKG